MDEGCPDLLFRWRAGSATVGRYTCGLCSPSGAGTLGTVPGGGWAKATGVCEGARAREVWNGTSTREQGGRERAVLPDVAKRLVSFARGKQLVHCQCLMAWQPEQWRCP